QRAGDDVLLERIGPSHRAAAGGNADDVGARGVDVAALRHRAARHGSAGTIGLRFRIADLRVQPHGARRQADRGRRADPQAAAGHRPGAPVPEEQAERVRARVAATPAGRVSTYGDIAAVAGLSSPRIVGWIMRTDSSDLPWHRVITASGRPARHLTTRQLELL